MVIYVWNKLCSIAFMFKMKFYSCSFLVSSKIVLSFVRASFRIVKVMWMNELEGSQFKAHELHAWTLPSYKAPVIFGSKLKTHTHWVSEAVPSCFPCGSQIVKKNFLYNQFWFSCFCFWRISTVFLFTQLNC